MRRPFIVLLFVVVALSSIVTAQSAVTVQNPDPVVSGVKSQPAGPVLSGRQQVDLDELIVKSKEQDYLEQIAQMQLQIAQLRAQLADVTAKLNSYELSALGQDLKIKREEIDLKMKKALGGTAEDELDKSVSPPRLVKKPQKKEQ